MKILSRPAVLRRISPFAASDFPNSARRHERKPSRPIGSSQNQSGFANQAARNKSNRRAAAHGGGCADNPRYVSMRSITAGSSIAAMIFELRQEQQIYALLAGGVMTVRDES